MMMTMMMEVQSQELRSDTYQVTQLFRGRTGFTQSGLVSAMLFPAL